MEREEYGLAERLLHRCAALLREYRVPLLAGLAAGLLAHGFVYTNKLVCADELTALFSKGGDFIFGRWLIGFTGLLFPDASMPWIYGLLSLFGYTVAACLTIRLFSVRNPFLQGLLAALFVSFPSVTSLYCYFFTCIPYVLALLLAVGSVCVGRRKGWLPAAVSVVLLVMSLGIYQAYVAVASTYYLLLMIRSLLRGEEEKGVFLFGLRAIGLLAAAVLLYYGIDRLVLFATGLSTVEYTVSDYGLLYKAALAYNGLFKAIVKGYFGFAPRPLSRLVHILGAAAVLLYFICWFVKNRDLRRGLLLALCLLLLPLRMNGIFLAASVEVIHSISLFSFVCVYVLAVLVAERLEGKAGRIARDAAVTGMLLLVIVNVYFANEVYLKLYLEYENAFATWSETVAQIRQTEGFDENCRIAIVGKSDTLLYRPDELDTGGLLGPTGDLVNIYSREYLIRYYLGFDAEFLSWEEAWELSFDPRVQAMPCCPYYGSVQRVDDVIVVKLGGYE